MKINKIHEKTSKCKRDQKKVLRRMRKNPSFISEVLEKAFNDQDEVNLYNKLSYLREAESFLDLGTVRFLVGNGYVMPVNKDKDDSAKLEKPQFDFSKQMYRITKKGLTKINGEKPKNNIKIEAKRMLRPKPQRLFVGGFALIAALIIAIILITNNSHAIVSGIWQTDNTDNIYPVIETVAQDENYGLVMFYYSGCSKCEVQIQELKEVISILNWQPYLLIDLNQATVFSEQKYAKNLLAAKNFGVETVPEIWLVRKDTEKCRVSYDYTPINDVLFRIYETYNDWNAIAGR